VGEAGNIQNMSLAADDRRVAIARIDAKTGDRDIWIIDSASGAESRVSFAAGEDDAPAWGVGGQKVLFVGQRDDSWSIVSQATLAATKEQVLFAHKGISRDNLNVNDVSPDGTLVLIQLRGSLGTADLWVLRDGTTTPEIYSHSKAFKADARFSPDGKWVAHQSGELTQRPNVYVQPYPATGGAFQISREVGFKPQWSRDGKELLFLNDEGLMVVPIDVKTGRPTDAPRLLFRVSLLGRGAIAGGQYGVTRDGQRFLMNLPQQESKPQALTVTTNWLAAARK
jgi:Tol biopolymer transport system component